MVSSEMISQIPRARPHLDRAKRAKPRSGPRGCDFCRREAPEISRAGCAGSHRAGVPSVRGLPNTALGLATSGRPAPRGTRARARRTLRPVPGRVPELPRPSRGRSRVGWLRARARARAGRCGHAEAERRRGCPSWPSGLPRGAGPGCAPKAALCPGTRRRDALSSRGPPAPCHLPAGRPAGGSAGPGQEGRGDSQWHSERGSGHNKSGTVCREFKHSNQTGLK